MLGESLREGRALTSRTKGVGRLNTRLAFYVYELRKLEWWSSQALGLQRLQNETVCLYYACQELEGSVITYV
jgi:hypothetical protein